MYKVEITCDNCQRSLRDSGVSKFTGEEDSMSPRCSLRLSIKSTGDLIDMDLCPTCAGKYLKALQKPLEDLL